MTHASHRTTGERAVCYFAAAYLSFWCLGVEIPMINLSLAAIGTLGVALAGLPLFLSGRIRLRWPLLLTSFVLLHIVMINPFDRFEFKIGLAAQLVVTFVFLVTIVNYSRDLDIYARMIRILLATTTLIVGTLIYIHVFVFHSQYLSAHFTLEAFIPLGRAGRNTLSFFLVVVFPFAYSRFSTQRSVYNAIVLGVVGFAALYTISRSALLSVLATVVLFGFLGTPPTRYRRQLVVLCLAVLVILPIGYGVNLWTTFLRLRNPEQIEAVESGDVALVALEGHRFDLIVGALRGFAASPLFGNGFGTAQADLGAETHNDFLRILYEFGLVGFLLFVAIIWSAYRDLRKCRQAVPSEYQWLVDGQTICLICTFGGLLTINAYDSPLVWFVLAGCQILPMAVAARRLSEASGPGQPLGGWPGTRAVE